MSLLGYSQHSRCLTPGITRRAFNETILQVSRMRATLFAVGCMPLLCGSSSFRRAERDLFP
jgi:hypothetical protein